MTERIKAAELRALRTSKRRDQEGPIHKAILQYLRFALPTAVIHHSPNEMNLHADAKSKAIAQSKAKALGMMTGFPDILVLWRGVFLGIEVKAPGKSPTDDQVAVGEAITAAGGEWIVATSVRDVEAFVATWRAHLDAQGMVHSVPMKGTIGETN